MTTPFNRQLNEPDLSDLLKALKRDVLQTLNCHALATVQSFDSAANTVVAKINYQQTYLQKDSTGYKQVYVDYPILIDVPVIFLCGGTSSLTFPVTQGDQCLILFNDRSISKWTAGARTGPTGSTRLHSLADGIALIGLNPVSDYDADHALLRYGNTKVGVSETKVLIENETRNLKTLLTNLTTAINSLNSTLISAFGANTTTVGTPVNPGAATDIGVVVTTITTIQTQLGELLE